MASGQAFLTLSAIGILVKPPNFFNPTASIRTHSISTVIRSGPVTRIRV